MTTKRKAAKPASHKTEKVTMPKKHEAVEQEPPPGYQAVADTGAKAPEPDNEPPFIQVPEAERLQTPPALVDMSPYVRRLSENLSSNLPSEAVENGEWDVPGDHVLRQIKLQVPDGKYRVIGHGWIMEIADQELAHITKATPTTDPAEYTTIE